MAPKKKPAKMANRKIGSEAALKDDGGDYTIVGDDGHPVYPRCPAWRRRGRAPRRPHSLATAASPASSPTRSLGTGRVEGGAFRAATPAA